MKKIILLLTLFLIITYYVVGLKRDEPPKKIVDIVDNNKNFSKNINNIPLPLDDKSYLYDNSLKATEVLEELYLLAEINNKEAIIKLVEINSTCSIASEDLRSIDEFIDIFEMRFNNNSNERFIFAQNISLFSANAFHDTDTMRSYLHSNADFCEGFNTDHMSQHEKQLVLRKAADHNYLPAKIALWSSFYIPFSESIFENSEDPANFDFVDLYDKKIEWDEAKIRHLYDAANYGDPRACVYLADALSYFDKKHNIKPNIFEAYKYYYLAFKMYGYVFIENRLELLKGSLDEEEIQTAEKWSNKF